MPATPSAPTIARARSVSPVAVVTRDVVVVRGDRRDGRAVADVDAAGDARLGEHVIELDAADDDAELGIADGDLVVREAQRHRVERDLRAIDGDAELLEHPQRAGADAAGADLLARIALGLEHDEARGGRGGLEVQRGREAGGPASDDHQVDIEHAVVSITQTGA